MLALLVVSFLTESTVGPVIYLVAASLTLPVGMLIYPALWINSLLTSAVASLFRLGDRGSEVLTLSGVGTVFVLAAIANALVLAELWDARRILGDWFGRHRNR
ncbi:hypothetical protein [Actinoplanes sp. NBRC 103695]|uniref:hypothetical protein n=1 Tax=Actinoplanes sp. NBRC 103695 TaxID=3032202 RepID=UPI002554EA34|nr:hypothetical protein [Actinoplanes sp. NBRC 103695]